MGSCKYEKTPLNGFNDIPSKKISYPCGHQRVWDGILGEILGIHGLEVESSSYGITTFETPPEVLMGRSNAQVFDEDFACDL